MGALRVEGGQPRVAGVPEVARLADDHHAERGHPGDLVGSRTTAVLDPMPVVGPGMRLQRRRVRVEDPVDGAVALGVDADLPAQGVGAGDRRPEVVLRRPVQGARELAVRAVRGR